jgi:diguanylate cyclase (GGDEF)-like protein
MFDLHNKRILLIDSNHAIHEDFHKLFCAKNLDTKLVEIEEKLFPDKIKKINAQQTYLIDSAYEGEQALALVQKAMTQCPYTVAFIDLHLSSGWDAMTTIQRIWEVDPNLQIVLCLDYSAYSWQIVDFLQNSTAVANCFVMEKLQGSDRFLILNKPFDVREIRQLVFYLSRKQDIHYEVQNQISQLEEKIHYQSTHDSLTSLGNRLLLVDCLQQAVELAKQHGSFVSVVLIAIDNLKEMNAAFGYAVSDDLLKCIAEKLKENSSEIDTLVRLGSHEFAIILAARENEKNIAAKIEQLHAAFLMPFVIENHSLFVSMHIGVSIYPRDGTEADAILKNAEAALCHAKTIGQYAIQFYNKEYHDTMLRRAELLIALPQALHDKQFILYYQPLIKADSNQILGVEALIRWQHPRFGLLYPQEFLPLAEETGLIFPLSEWVLKTACAKAKKWQETIYPELTIAVNVSAYQVCQPDFVDFVQKTLKKIKFEARYLELEIIANSMLMEDPDILHKMRQLKELGVSFSLNNFGVGYANLNYLEHLPFNKVKIDRSFVKNIELNSKENIVIESIINFAKKLGIKVVAEGVETPEQVEFLFTHHGDQMQGFYFSPPLNEEACTALLEKQGSFIKVEN